MRSGCRDEPEKRLPCAAQGGTFCPAMRRPRLVFFFVLVSLATARAEDWKLIKCGGRDHVTLQNLADFYGLGRVQRVSNSLQMGQPNRSLRGSTGSNELFINNLKFILSYPISEYEGQPIVSRMDLTKVIEPVLRPSRIKDAAQVSTIVLDPGHGGHDNGAMSFWGNEKTYALDVALRAKPLLEENGLNVVMTRATDIFVPLEDRVRIANQYPNALFVAIHFNSGGANASGVETYTLAPRGVPSMAADGPRLSDLQPCAGNVCDAENMALATAMHASVVCHSQLYDRGIKRARFVVIRDIKIPGVLIEGGFLSNENDARKIASVSYRQTLAACIVTAVQNYRRALSPDTPQTLVAGNGDAPKKPTAPMVVIPTAN